MNLEEMKQALSSDATEKCKKYEKRIVDLEQALSAKDKIIKGHEETMRFLFNRCFALTSGTLCLFCGETVKCDKFRSVGKGGGK